MSGRHLACGHEMPFPGAVPKCVGMDRHFHTGIFTSKIKSFIIDATRNDVYNNKHKIQRGSERNEKSSI